MKTIVPRAEKVHSEMGKDVDDAFLGRELKEPIYY